MHSYSSLEIYSRMCPAAFSPFQRSDVLYIFYVCVCRGGGMSETIYRTFTVLHLV